MKRIAFLVAFLFALSTPALAQSPDEITPEYVETLERQVEVVEAQNEIMREQSDSLLTVATWAIGVVVAVIAAAFFFTAWMSYRYSEREKDIFLADLQNRIDSRLEEAIPKLNNQYKKHESTLSERMEEAIRDINEDQEKLKSTLIKEFKNSIEDLEKTIKKVEFETKYDIIEDRIRENVPKYREVNLAKLSELFHVAKEADIISYLGDMIRMTRISLERLETIQPFTEAKIMKALKTLPEENRKAKTRIEEMIEEKTTE